MIERPIMFSGEMVKAILAGRKTQTRRTVGGAPDGVIEVVPSLLASAGDLFDFRRNLNNPMALRCPYGKRGDRLWVREAHALVTRVNYPWETAGIITKGAGSVAYRASVEQPDAFTWRPSIFLPRWASRITLEVTEVRVQRLQEISEDDAKTEGVEPSVTTRKVYPSAQAADVECRSYRDGFATLWDAINGARRRREYVPLGERGYPGTRSVIDTSARWDANPWVWAISFRRLP